MSDTLILNRQFYAIQVVSWQKAITLLYRGHAVALDEECNRYNFDEWRELSQMIEDHPAGFVNSVSFKIAIPEVIALLFYDELPKGEVKFTRRNIYKHYNNKCCYCDKQFGTEDLNLDHVMPKSREGKSDWDNIVLSCIPCNTEKADRTPQEAKMKMHYQPARPKWKPSFLVKVNTGFKARTSWRKFVDKVYWDSEIEN